MASVYDLKPRFQAILRPVTGRLAAMGVTANLVTLAATLLSIGVGGFLAWNANVPAVWWSMPLTLFVRMALNAIDGMLAREHGQKSRLGAILNELGDVVSDAALYLPLAFCDHVPAIGVVSGVIAAILVEFTGVVAVQIGASRRYDGPMGKSDRAFWIGAFSVGLAMGWIDSAIASGFLAILVILSIWTVIQRARRALKEGSVSEPTVNRPVET